MVKLQIVKTAAVTAFLVLITTGCSTIQAPGAPEEVSHPARTSQEATEAPAPESRPPVKAEPDMAKPVPPSPAAPALEPIKQPPAGELTVDTRDVEFVQRRLQEYENKFEQWLELSDTATSGPLSEELTALETECVQKLDNILTGYSLLLKKMRQSGGMVTVDNLETVDPKDMQQLDIAFLESRCGQLLAMDMTSLYAAKPEFEPQISFDAAQEHIAAEMQQGNYQEALSAFGRLALDYPGRKPSLATRLDYALALRHTGQVEAAARYLKSLLASGDLTIEPLRLQREFADLLLAGGDIAAAKSVYASIIQGYDAFGPEKKWAEEQLSFLQTAEPESEDMTAYLKLLREFQTYDYRTYAPRLNEAVLAFTTAHAGSPVSVSALRLKAFTVDQLKYWFGRQLIKIDTLVEEKKFDQASDILQNMTRYYLPADLQAVVQKTFYEVAQAEIQAKEVQRRMQEMELTEQWDAAVSLLDSQRYDLAITAFEAFKGTEYEERANIKITEAANQAAGQLRKEAASLFIRAGKSADLEQKKELLLASHRLLTEILAKYPQTDLVPKVQQNIAILEKQIQRFDPALLDELQQENPVAVPAPPGAPETGTEP